MADYRVDLDIFAGPLDLLLYLVRKEEVDIYDIPISRVTEQYVKYIEMLKLVDIDLAGTFLVMAATLMEIKSVMLLPQAESGDVADDESGDPRSELVRQLLEYKKFKDAANMLHDSADERQERHVRPDTIIANLKKSQEPEVDLDEIGIWDLLEAFDKIMQSTGNFADYSSITDDTPIDLYQIELLHRLQTDGPMTFERAFEGKTNKFAMVGIFLAMLELMRNQLLWVEQTDAEGQIYIRSITDEPAEQAVQNAIYRRAEEEEEELAEQEAATGEAAEMEAVVDELVQVDEPDEDEEFDRWGDNEIAQEAQDIAIPIVELEAKEKGRRDEGVGIVERSEIPDFSNESDRDIEKGD